MDNKNLTVRVPFLSAYAFSVCFVILLIIILVMMSIKIDGKSLFTLLIKFYIK